ncbi:unnamed protein product [Prorocentrum cordatum]|uniref:Uncharacterized protein n=1 Tax=Prorocentrum cordatum TaxID=2364126 RepID=A0ABN9VBW6_9DINO|nr:unnamed protein product [Polarella glacialis]
MGAEGRMAVEEAKTQVVAQLQLNARTFAGQLKEHLIAARKQAETERTQISHAFKKKKGQSTGSTADVELGDHADILDAIVTNVRLEPRTQRARSQSGYALTQRKGGRERVLGCMLLRASRRGSASESGSSGSAQSGSRRRSWSQRSAARRGTLADPGPRQRVGAPEEPRDLEPRQRVGAPEEPRDLEPRQWAVDLEVARDAEPQVQV